jgi:hypothetical protein
MSAGTPISGAQITGVSPSTGEPQSTEDVLITGASTNFDPASTTVGFGPDIVVNSVTVVRPTILIANITVAATAAAGPRDVTVTTGSESATGSGKFTVLAASASQNPPIKPPKPLTPQQYSVLINLSSQANPPGGNVWTLQWYVDGKLMLAVNPADHMLNPPYLPSFQPATFNVSTVQFTMHAPDGTAAVLCGPFTYTVAVGAPDLDLTIPLPVFSFSFVQPMPFETLSVKGQSVQACMFGSMLETVVGTNKITLPQVQEMTGNTSDGVSAPVNTAALAAEAQSLRPDAVTPAGAIDPATQQALLSLSQQAMSAVSIPASQATSFAQMGDTFAAISAPWSYRSRIPVNQTLSFNQGGLKITLALYVAIDELDD